MAVKVLFRWTIKSYLEQKTARMFSRTKLILTIILVITFSVAAYFLIVVIPARLAEQTYNGVKQIGRDISSALQFTPQITVNNTVIVQQQAPILELATMSETFQHHYEWVNTRLGSTKRISIKGGFRAKAGFDLRKKFLIEISDDVARVYLPKSELLSVESLNNTTFEDENGYWNWVNMDDRSNAINAFTRDAKKYAQTSDFVNQAQTEMEKKLREILTAHGKKVEIIYTEPIKLP